MKYTKKALALAILATIVLSSFAMPASAEHVNGYYRSNGTYVQPYERSAPDGTVTNNYSYEGNVNPYTGAVGTNQYQHDATSPYFNGTPDSNGNIGHSGAYNAQPDPYAAQQQQMPQQQAQQEQMMQQQRVQEEQMQQEQMMQQQQQMQQPQYNPYTGQEQ